MNQDALFVHQEPSYWVFGVCDGHGTNGHFVSEFIKQRLPARLKETVKEFSIKHKGSGEWMPNSMREAVREETARDT